MSLPFIVSSVPVATVIAYGTHFAKVFVLAGKFDNTRPRDPIAEKQDVPESRREMAMRLHGAHLNMMETLGLFAGGVACAIASQAHLERVTAACAAYLAFRLLFVVVYAAPQFFDGVPRTGIFVLSMSCLMWLWIESAVAMGR